jgi:hypothetical protein
MAAPRLATWAIAALAFIGCVGAAAQDRPRPGFGSYDAAPLDDSAVGRCGAPLAAHWSRIRVRYSIKAP